MQNLFVITENVIMLFCLVLIGYIAVKSNYLNKQIADGLSKIITRLTFPAMILAALISPNMTMKDIKASFPLYIVTIIYVVVMLCISFLVAKLVKVPKNEKPAFIYLMACSNVIFMGMPICTAIFGQDSAFYVSVVAIGQDTVLWTVGVLLLSKMSTTEQKAKFKINPVTIAFFVGLLLRLLDVPIPKIVYEPIKTIGTPTSYLAMIYLGMILSANNIKKVLNKWQTYIYLVMKLLVFPLIAGFIAYKLLGSVFSEVQKGVFMVEIATASVVALLPVFKEYDQDPEYASGLVFSGVILCLFTIPLVLFLSQLLYK
jgi:predicted permease